MSAPFRPSLGYRLVFPCMHFNMFYGRFCASCVRNKERAIQEVPSVYEPLEDEKSDSKVFYGLATLKGEQYRVGDSVYLPPDAFNFL